MQKSFRSYSQFYYEPKTTLKNVFKNMDESKIPELHIPSLSLKSCLITMIRKLYLKSFKEKD